MSSSPPTDRPVDDPFAAVEEGAALPAVRRHGRRPPRAPAILALILGILVVLGIVVSGGTYAVAAAGHALPAATTTVSAPALPSVPRPDVAWPSYGAGAVGAVEVEGTLEDGVLARYGSTEQLPIGSIAKVVTALMVLDAKPIAEGTDGETITFDQDDVDYYTESLAENGSVAPVSAGLQLTERQALTMLMLPSANNYSSSLVDWAYGSKEAFLAASRGWLDARGLDRTVMADSSGLSPATVSTTAEMIVLGRLLLADPVLAPIVAMPSTVVPGVGEIENTNALLGRAGVDGIKTGTTDEAGACLLFSADAVVDGTSVTLVGVIVGADTHPELAADVATLLPSVASGFSHVEIAEAGEDFGAFESAWGTTAVAASADDVDVFVWGGGQPTTSVALAPVGIVDDGALVGTATVTIAGRSYDVPLVAEGAIDDPGLGWRLTHPDTLFAGG